MALLVFALIVLLIVALCIYALQVASPDPKLTKIGTIMLLLIAIVVIAQKAGWI